MLIKESQYLRLLIESLHLNGEAKVLNIGSQDEKYLEIQKHIKENIVKPTLSKGARIYNLDIRDGSGVDIVGDVTNAEFSKKLRRYSFSVIYLFNVLEHVEDIDKFTGSIESLMQEDAYLIISVPFLYPIHFDPIDNLFRPTPEEVAKYFPNCKIVNSAIIKDYTYWYYITSSLKRFIIEFTRILTPFYKFNKWINVVIPKLKWLNRNFEVTCIILQKKNQSVSG